MSHNSTQMHSADTHSTENVAPKEGRKEDGKDGQRKATNEEGGDGMHACMHLLLDLLDNMATPFHSPGNPLPSIFCDSVAIVGGFDKQCTIYSLQITYFK